MSAGYQRRSSVWSEFRGWRHHIFGDIGYLLSLWGSSFFGVMGCDLFKAAWIKLGNFLGRNVGWNWQELRRHQMTDVTVAHSAWRRRINGM